MEEVLQFGQSAWFPWQDNPYDRNSFHSWGQVNSSRRRINAKLKAFEEWTAKSLDDRQVMLIDLGKVVWETSLIEDA